MKELCYIVDKKFLFHVDELFPKVILLKVKKKKFLQVLKME